MAIRFFKAATPGTRHGSVLDFSEVASKKPEKSLTTWWSRSKGRNNRGIITSRHRGGGHGAGAVGAQRVLARAHAALDHGGGAVERAARAALCLSRPQGVDGAVGNPDAGCAGRDLGMPAADRTAS